MEKGNPRPELTEEQREEERAHRERIRARTAKPVRRVPRVDPMTDAEEDTLP